MPIPNYGPLLLLSLCTSILYGIYSTFVAFTRTSDDVGITVDLKYLLPDLLYIVGLNVVGLCFRIRRECVTRRVLLTRHLNVEESLLLKFAKDQEVRV